MSGIFKMALHRVVSHIFKYCIETVLKFNA